MTFAGGPSPSERRGLRGIVRVARRPTRYQLALLTLVGILAVGPIVATVLVISTDTGPVTQLVDGPPADRDGAEVTVTLFNVTPTTGEVRARIVIEPGRELVDDDALAEGLVLGVNDIRGEDSHTYRAGEAPQPVETTLALTDGSIRRYPFDTYKAVLLLSLTRDADGDDRAVPFTVDVLSTVDEFDVGATPGATTNADGTGPATGFGPAGVDLRIERETTSSVYAAWMMLLMWALAVAGVGIVWVVVIWQVEVPWWGLGYFVGVLFALPALREALPGRPPAGSLVDFVAFYWAVAILGVGLVALVAIWTQRTRLAAKRSWAANRATWEDDGEAT